MSLKLDMNKVYDRVEWNFLDNVMEKMGFNGRWRHLIMLCVRIVSFSIMVNGIPKGLIFPTRGLRQGNHLCPYLFILCTEGLITLLKQAEHNKLVEGIKIYRGLPKINHLPFADDNLRFCRATMQANFKIQHLLEVYERASGKKVNKEKTSIVFSKNVEFGQQEEILAF